MSGYHIVDGTFSLGKNYNRRQVSLTIKYNSEILRCSERCPAGTYRSSEMTTCTICDKTSFSEIGATECTVCEVGTVANEDNTECGE